MLLRLCSRTNLRAPLSVSKRKAEDGPNGTVSKRSKDSESEDEDGEDGESTARSPVKPISFPGKVWKPTVPLPKQRSLIDLDSQPQRKSERAK